MNDSNQHPPKTRWAGLLFSTAICLLIFAASILAVYVINRTEPTAKQINATRKSSAIVEIVTVERGTYSPRLAVLGTVRPAQDITLSPRVRGQVIELSPKFVPGGMVEQGDLLLRIDPADFENAVSIRNSELQQSEASLEIEEGRQSLAKKELALLGESIDETNRALVLREPQYDSIKAQVAAAQAAVERAELDLARTRLIAPFDAQIMTRSINVGSQVATSDNLAQLVGVEEYWVMAAVPVRSLRWVEFFESDGNGSEVILRNDDAWGPGVERSARVTRMIGQLDRQTRLARVLISVSDPLGLESDAPPLILDTLIQAEIVGRAIENVVRLRREYVHDGDTVWVKVDGKLEIRKTSIVFRDAKHAYINQGLDNGDEVVISTLATVANGVGLRTVDEDSGQSAAAKDDTDRESSL